jgi:hypothetical protein
VWKQTTGGSSATVMAGRGVADHLAFSNRVSLPAGGSQQRASPEGALETQAGCNRIIYLQTPEHSERLQRGGLDIGGDQREQSRTSSLERPPRLPGPGHRHKTQVVEALPEHSSQLAEREKDGMDRNVARSNVAQWYPNTNYQGNQGRAETVLFL